MKLSRKWLNVFVNLPLTEVDDRAFTEAMSVSGSKVEVTEDLSKSISNVVAACVISLTPHPDSDHMFVVHLNAGEEHPDVQVVTGAQNLHEGDLVPLALPGALLPNGMRIESAMLRGVPSEGMLCSLKELNLSNHDFPEPGVIMEGIFVLPDKSIAPGTDLTSYLGYDDHVVEFEITPNRPDCLCMLGLAREAAVTFHKPLYLHTPVVRADAGGDINRLVKIIIEEPELCRRYTARMVRNVRIAPSPVWMRERIRAAGMRPINNLVDITNYVMLEYGQPMHAFDFSCVRDGEIHVRCAREGESIRTLDGTDRPLNPSMLCICDTERPVGVAGVMGGENSEIVGDTAMVLFESANFEGVSIRRTATALGMRTDASSRYEKGLDPENTIKAVQRACELVELLGAGEVVDGVIDVYPTQSRETVLPLDPNRINALLGTDLDVTSMADILTDLGFTVDESEHPENPLVHVPSWRADVVHYSDLAEEVARFYGYNNIPTCFTTGATSVGGFSPEQQCERKIGETLRSLGLDEIITYSFISPSAYDRIRMPADSPLRESLRILNPLGEDTSIMRTTLLPSMMDILTRNYNFRNERAFLYEIGRSYHKRPDGLAEEPKTVSIGAYGPGMDFFALKGFVEELLEALGIPGVHAHFSADSSDPAFHPGQCAVLTVNGQFVGILGRIHPLVMKNYGVDGEFYCAQLSFETLFRLQGGTPVFQALPRFPAVTRDIAVVCDLAIPAGDMKDAILSAGGDCLKDCQIFDVYTGHHIAAGKKSVAFSLTIRSDDHTLTDEDAESAVKNVLAVLKERFGAEIR